MAACRHIDTRPKSPKDGHGGPNRLHGARVPASPYPPTPPIPTHPPGTGLRGIPQACHATSPHDPITPTHSTPPPKATAPPRGSSGGAGPTRSSGSCESGPEQSPPSRAWSTGPARGRRRTAASSRQGVIRTSNLAHIAVQASTIVQMRA